MPTISGAKSGITARKVTRLTRAEFRSWMSGIPLLDERRGGGADL